MTEGPRVRAIAYTINRYVAGKTLELAVVRSRRIRVPVESLLYRKLTKADSFGKNLVIFLDEYAIRIHTLMYGRIKLYRAGEPYEKPENQVRVKLVFGDHHIVGFNTPIVEVDLAENIVSYLEKTLGPDPYRPSWSRDIVIEKLRSRKNEKIGVVILDQSVVAGVGNILRNEILYRAKINPERVVQDLSDEEINRLLDVLEDLFRVFLDRLIEGGDIKELLLVYNRYRGKCVFCGSPIKCYRQPPIGRKTFVCPKCQR